jgi:hypothetical protein
LTATSLIPLALLGLSLWLWQNTLKIHELAVTAARQTCSLQNLQLLDGTVMLHRLSVKRNPAGHLTLRRTFLFAYSQDGIERHTGFIIMLGSHIEQVGL